MFHNLYDGFQTGMIDSNYNSNLAYRPQFLSNDYKHGRKVLANLEEELLHCDTFIISVAFITEGGIAPLLQTFRELERRGVQGKILTTDYLTFSEPKALKKLDAFSNIEIRMHVVNPDSKGFHTKGYVFYNQGILKTIIGSSNLTLSALTQNREWNVKFVSTEQGEVIQDILTEFYELWNQAACVSDLIETYEKMFQEHKSVLRRTTVPSIAQYQLKPNSMQLAFIHNLEQLRKQQAEKALLISATGTGKTYASAFALRNMNPPRALFLVHREQIAKQAIISYRHVFGDTKTFGLLSGNSKEMEADYLFSTMQMMAKPEIMSQFAVDEFPVIIIDEVHRAGAESYQRIMNYFKPRFWLGMTASPDRMDGYDIYGLFDHNIAYEIRLQQALEEDLLCPFHYFGISDLEIDGETFDDAAGLRNFNLLTSNQRVDYIIKQAAYFGHSGDRVKGLVFCSRKEEAKKLSEKFNARGFHTVALSGEDSQAYREEMIERLAADGGPDYLDYIFTVDIFNEGVDIPEVNQIIMLRPTESPVIFIQQLGRGLRKANQKEYVIILDFIGNYQNNFMIPIALSGDRSYNKDTIRKYIREGTRVIPGSSSIHFDEISRKRIYASIDRMTTTKRLLTEKYLILKNKLGRIPSLMDFYNNSEIDPLLFISYAGSYHGFLKKIYQAEKDYHVEFTLQQERILEFVSSVLANGKRPHELLMLQCILSKEKFNRDELDKLLEAYGIEGNTTALESAYRVLSGQFMNTQTEKEKYSIVELIKTDEIGTYIRAWKFYLSMQTKEFTEQMKDVVVLGLQRYRDIYMPNADESGLCLYQKYSRKDVCRLLNWQQDDSSTIYGYRIKYNTCPIFVTYEKKEDITSSTKYEDQFINNRVFSWMTRSRVSIESSEAQELIHFEENNLKLYLFIKKSDGEGSDFYYMGQVIPKTWRETTIQNDKGQNLPIMNFQLELQHAVREDIYDYISDGVCPGDETDR